MTLIDITGTILDLERILEEGEMNPTGCEQAISDYLSGIEENELSDKLDSYVKLMRHLDREEEALKQESVRYLEASRVRGNRKKSLESRLKMFFEATGRTEAKAGLATVKLQPNGGKRALVVDESKIPDSYATYSTIKQFDLERIRRELESGSSLDFAELKPQGSHIKVKL